MKVQDSITSFCSSFTIIPIFINNLPCSVNANFTYLFGYFIGNLTFYNSNPYNSAILYNWNFGDGNTSTLPIPAHTYTTSGTYTITLIASEGSTSCTATSNSIVIIPTCSVIANFTYNLGNNGLVSFTNTSITTNNLTGASWYFDNGNYGNGNVLTYNYLNNGNYNVFLTCYDSIPGVGHCFDTLTIPISVSNVTCGLAATANAWGTNFNGYFSASITSTNTTNSIWYFGDGTQSTSLVSNHTYSLNGVYSPTFTVWQTTTPTCSITIITNTISIVGTTCSLTPNFNFTAGTSGLVTFSAASIISSSLTNYNWVFGDGNTAFGTLLTTTSNNYLTNGVYNVSLYLIDSLGTCFNYTIIPINITNSPNLGCSANSIFTLYKDFTQNYSWYAYPNYQSNAVLATWSWGDGSTSSGFYPVHTYSAAGYYNICLTVSLSCGSQSTTCNNTNIYKTTTNVTNNNMLTVSVKNTSAVGIKINQTYLQDVILYPNPNKGSFNINLSASKNEIYNVEIYNSLGQLIYKSTISNEQSTINIEGNSAGLYYVKLKGEGSSKTFKFVKE